MLTAESWWRVSICSLHSHLSESRGSVSRFNQLQIKNIQKKNPYWTCIDFSSLFSKQCRITTIYRAFTLYWVLQVTQKWLRIYRSMCTGYMQTHKFGYLGPETEPQKIPGDNCMTPSTAPCVWNLFIINGDQEKREKSHFHWGMYVHCLLSQMTYR